MSEEEGKSEGTPKSSVVEVNIDDVMDRMMPKDASALKAGPIFKRREITFTMSGADCESDVFVDANGDPIEFEVTVVGLTHQEEIEATRQVKHPTDLPFMLAKRALFKLSGKMLSDKQRNFLWEAVGAQGRQVLVTAYGMVNAATDEALGKLQDDWEV